MTTVTIPEAQANLPEIVENLKPGEEVIITNQGLRRVYAMSLLLDTHAVTRLW